MVRIKVVMLAAIVLSGFFATPTAANAALAGGNSPYVTVARAMPDENVTTASCSLWEWMQCLVGNSECRC